MSLWGVGGAQSALMPSAPKGAHRHARGLTGDVRPNLAGPFSVQLVDAEYDEPGAFLLTGLSQGVGAPTWTIRTGLDRAVLVQQLQITNDFFSQIIVARSVTLSVASANVFPVGPNQFVQAVIVPIDLSFSALDFSNGQSAANGVGVVTPNVGDVASVSSVAASVASQVLANAVGTGAAIQNTSPAGKNLYIRLATIGAPVAAVIAAGGYTQKIAPDGYYETPFGFTGSVTGIWDGADGAGFAQITTVSG